MKSGFSLASRIDHTMLKQNVPLELVDKICMEALLYGFASVAIHPANIERAYRILKGTTVGITAAISYPNGSWSAEMKAGEITDAIARGASDCDFVININALKNRDYQTLRDEAKICRKAIGNRIMKVILEVCLLTEEEIRTACSIYSEEGADFIKSSTGYRFPPTEKDVQLMREATPEHVQIKAAGGIRTAADAQRMILAGADRLGTSAGVSILKEWQMLS